MAPWSPSTSRTMRTLSSDSSSSNSEYPVPTINYENQTGDFISVYEDVEMEQAKSNKSLALKLGVREAKTREILGQRQRLGRQIDTGETMLFCALHVVRKILLQHAHNTQTFTIFWFLTFCASHQSCPKKKRRKDERRRRRRRGRKRQTPRGRAGNQ